MIARLRADAEATARQALGTEPQVLDPQANFFGLETRGVTQIRGNGCLALDGAVLVFVQWVPRRTLRISRDRIASVEQASSHLGKTSGMPLLRVRFKNDSGKADTVAWAVQDLGGWLLALTAEGARG